MADATITIGADAAQAQATIEELRGITNELFKGIGGDAQQAAVAQNALIEAFQNQKLTVLEANDAASVLRPQLESLTKGHTEAGTAAKEHGFNLKELSKSFLGTVSVVALLRENLKDLKPSLQAAGSEFRRAAQDIGLSEDSASILTNTFEMMVNPFTIVENLTANLKISAEQLAAALYDEASAADASTEAQQRKAGVLATVLSEQQKLVASVERSRESLDLRTEALTRQIQVEQQAGEVSGAYRNKLEALLNEYDRLGEEPPQKVKDLAASLGVLSSEQERAAKQAEHHTGKLREEKAAVQESKSEFDGIIETLGKFTDGKGAQAAATDAATKALLEETKALGENAKAAEKAAGDAQGKAADAAKRIAELEGQSLLTVDEQNELNSLKEQQVGLEVEAANAAEGAAQATFEYGAAQSELAGATNEALGSVDGLTSAENELQQATEALAQATRDAGGDMGEAFGGASAEFETFYDRTGQATQTVEKFGDVLMGVGEDGQVVISNFEAEFGRTEDQINGAADAAKKIPTALDKIGPAAEKAGESLTGLNDALGDKEGGFGKTAEALREVVTLLEQTHELSRAIRVEFQRISNTIGGSGAQQ